MSTSSNNWQNKGKGGMGNAGKRKEMVKDWHVQRVCRQFVCGQVVWTSCDKLCVDKRATKTSPVPEVPEVPRLSTETKVDVTKSHTSHAGCTSMSPSATPATQKAAASTASFGNQARHQSQPSAISATPATQSEGGCHQVPRLPRKVTVDVTKCHACHAK